MISNADVGRKVMCRRGVEYLSWLGYKRSFVFVERCLSCSISLMTSLSKTIQFHARPRCNQSTDHSKSLNKFVASGQRHYMRETILPHTRGVRTKHRLRRMRCEACTA